MTVKDARLTRSFDLAERVVLIVLYGLLAVRIFAGVQDSPYNLLLLVSEGMVLFFLVIRRMTDQISLRPLDWAVGFAGTAAPMFVTVGGENLLPPLACAGVMVYGLVISTAAKLSLQRSFGVVAANRGVRRSGPYRYVRHPMYAGYFITAVGYLLLNPLLWNLALFVGAAALQVARILAEERMLSQDEAYRDYAAAVRFRLVPGLF